MPSARMCIILAILLLRATSAATAQGVYGDIQGTILDGSGARLAGVTVTITHAATGFARETTTNDEGFFAVAALPVGQYEVQASHQGFATQRQPGVWVQPGRIITLRMELGVAPAPETITVANTATILETTQSHVAATFDLAEVQHLPVRDRNVLALALLAPGVTGNALTGDVSVGGQPGALNRITIDGADRERPFGGPARINPEAVEQLQVSTSAYPAESGRAGGGIISVVTRSGSNELRGSVLQYFGDTELAAAAGAPIVRNRHFVFGAYDARRVTKQNDVGLNLPPDTPSDAATRAAIDRLGTRTSSWDRAQDDNLLLVRTDHQLSERHHLDLRYHHEDVQGRGLDLGPNVAAEAAGLFDASGRAFTAAASSAIGSALFNEARVHVGRDRDTGEPGNEAPHATIRQSGTDVLRIGRNDRASRDATVTRVQVGDTLTWVRGANTLKAGFDVRFDNVRSLVPGHFAGSYTFGTLASFNRGVPSGRGDAYTQTFEGAGTPGRVTQPDVLDYSVFAQDEWRVDEALTVNIGLRYDAQTFAHTEVRNPDGQLAAAGIDTSSIGSDVNNVGPRLGVAWAPVGSGFVVRGGYGVVYGRTPWTMVATAQANNGINLQTIAFRSANGDPVPAFPNHFAARPAVASLRPTIVVFDPAYENARVQQASGGVEWEWMPDTWLSANYLVARGDNLPRAVDLNVVGRPFTSFARVISYESGAQSRYHGITIELARRFAQGHQYRVSYTLGRVEDTMPSVAGLVPDTLDDRHVAANDARALRAPGDADHRNRLVATIIHDTNRWSERYDGLMRSLFRDWTFSAVYTAQTGAPYSAYVSGDINGDNNRFNDLAPGTTRNQYRLPTSISLDTRLVRDVTLKGDMRLAFIWETINLMDRDNSNLVNNTFYDVAGGELRPNPLFGQVLGPIDGRTMLAGVRFSF